MKALITIMLAVNLAQAPTYARDTVVSTSYYKKNETKSDTTIECHAGAIMSGVALKGTYATVE